MAGNQSGWTAKVTAEKHEGEGIMTEQQLEQVREKIGLLEFDIDCYGLVKRGKWADIICLKPKAIDQILNITIQLPCKKCEVNGCLDDDCPTCKGKGYKEVTIKEIIENG